MARTKYFKEIVSFIIIIIIRSTSGMNVRPSPTTAIMDVA